MLAENVYYLKVRAYYYPFTEKDIIKRINHQHVLKRVLCTSQTQDIQIFTQFLIKYLKKSRYHFAEKSFLDYEMDKVISIRIQTHLTDFFENMDVKS